MQPAVSFIAGSQMYPTSLHPSPSLHPSAYLLLPLGRPPFENKTEGMGVMQQHETRGIFNVPNQRQTLNSFKKMVH